MTKGFKMLTNEKYRVLVRMGRPREGDTWTLFYSPPPLQLIFSIRLQVFVVFVHPLISYRHFFVALVTMEEKLRSGLFGEVCK